MESAPDKRLAFRSLLTIVRGNIYERRMGFFYGGQRSGVLAQHIAGGSSPNWKLSDLQTGLVL